MAQEAKRQPFYTEDLGQFGMGASGICGGQSVTEFVLNWYLLFLSVALQTFSIITSHTPPKPNNLGRAPNVPLCSVKRS